MTTTERDRQTRFHFHGALSGLVREDELYGRPHLVAPVVMLREMVLDQGDHGELMPGDAIEMSVARQLWEGRPVTIRHPDENGRFVSAGVPEIADRVQIGTTRNVTSGEVGGAVALRGEAWIDVEQAERLDEGVEIVERLREFTSADRPPGASAFEVSTGYWATLDPTDAGFHRGARYRGAQREIIPDHLAVLPDQIGKCSLEDGCGLPRVNARGVAVVPATLDVDGDEVSATVLAEARRPAYSEAVEGEAPDDWPPSLSDFVAARGWDAETWDDLTEDQQQVVAWTTLLGEPQDTFAASVAFPVVDAGGNLRENALDAVLEGRGAQVQVPEGALESAHAVARSLLEDEFDRELEENVVRLDLSAVRTDDPTLVDRLRRTVRNAVESVVEHVRYGDARENQEGRSLDDVRDAVRDAIEVAAGGSDRWTHVVELFEDAVVFAVDPEGEPEALFRATYEIDDGEATLGEPERVERRVEYEPVENDDEPEAEGETPMLNDEQRTAIIAALVSCSACSYDEDALGVLADGDLIAIARNREVEPDGVNLNDLGADPDASGEGGGDSTAAAEGDSAGDGDGDAEPQANDSREAILEALSDFEPDEIRAALEGGRDAARQNAERKDELVDRLVRNDRCRLTRETLEQMTPDALARLDESFDERSYALAAGPRRRSPGAEGESYFDRNPRTPAVVTREVRKTGDADA